MKDIFEDIKELLHKEKPSNCFHLFSAITDWEALKPVEKTHFFLNDAVTGNFTYEGREYAVTVSLVRE